MLTEHPRLKGLTIIVGLFAFGIAITAVLVWTGADLGWTSEFYGQGGANQGWIYGRETPWAQLYDYGEIPPFLLLAGALGLYVAAWLGRARSEYKRACLVMILTVVIGPGLLVNGILKEYWGRPRPVQVSEFGGEFKYQKPWEMGVSGRGKSFTSGHASIGFATSSAVALYPLHPALSVGALVLGITYGIVMGVARVAQGGHFPSDVLWSGIIVLILVTALYYLVFRIPEHQTPRKTRADRLGDPANGP